MSTVTDHPEGTRSGRGWLIADTWSSFKRWMRKSLRNPFTVFFTLIQPVIWLVLFTQVFKAVVQIPGFTSDSYLAFFAPAVVIQIALFSGGGSGVGLVFDMREGMFNKLLASPMNRTAMFVGKTLSGAVMTSIQVVIALGLALVLGAPIETGLLGAVVIIGIALLFSLGFVALSNIVGLVTQDDDATILATQFLTLPLLFMSTAFLQENFLPEWVQTVSAFNPVTYGVDAIRTLMLDGWVWSVLGPSVVGLVLFDLLFGAIAVVLLRRATSAEVR